MITYSGGKETERGKIIGRKDKIFDNELENGKQVMKGGSGINENERKFIKKKGYQIKNKVLGQQDDEISFYGARSRIQDMQGMNDRRRKETTNDGG